MILVIGGAGYIGSHMLDVLRLAGEEHLTLDNLERGHRQATGDSKLLLGDIREPSDIDGVFKTYPNIDIVMHFSAYAYVGESVQEPKKYWHNNVIGTINLLDAMLRANVMRIVFSSTCATFGEPSYIPIDENHPQKPINPYGETKLTVEKVLKTYDIAYGVQSVSLRYFNAAGAHPGGHIGEDHRPEVHLLPLAILSAIGRTGPCHILGEDYDTPDGTCIRDYIHVMDLCDAHLLAVEHLRSGGGSRNYNLGNGLGYSVREVIQTVGNVVGKSVPVVLSKRRQGDPAKLVGDASRVRSDWGWEARYPDIRTITEHALRWHLGHPFGYGA